VKEKVDTVHQSNDMDVSIEKK